MSGSPRRPLPEGRDAHRLEQWQRLVAGVLLGPGPREADLQALGAPKRWRIYRHMVRHRLLDMVRSGLPRTAQALGEDRFEAWFGRWLAQAPPTTRFIRDVVGEATDHWLPRWAAGEAPRVEPWLPDLCRYEAAVWRCRWALDPEDGDLAPFDFARPPRFSPACELLRLRFPVYRRPTPASGYQEAPAAVLLCRHPETMRVRYHVLPPLEADVTEAWMDEARRPAVETARQVAERHDLGIDRAFAERLGALAARLMEAGALLGSAPTEG